MNSKLLMATSPMLLFAVHFATCQSAHSPSLGLGIQKDVSAVLDQDALTEETELDKRLPGNEFVKDKPAFHEAALMNQFVEAFKNTKACHGIVLYLKDLSKKPDFRVQLSGPGHDKHPDDQTWTWMLSYPGDPSPANSPAHGMGGLGNQSNATLTARDVCLTIWDDIDPNHFKKPGGTVQ
jgi:hypothetical protein